MSSNPARQTAEALLPVLEHVSLDTEALSAVAADFRAANYQPSAWHDAPLNHPGNQIDTAKWVFTISTLNFCFWQADGSPVQCRDEASGKTYSGYWSLCAAVNNAIRDGVDLLNPLVLSTITSDTLGAYLGSGVQLLAERAQALNEMGAWLVKVGGVEALLAKYTNAVDLSVAVSSELSSYRDRVALPALPPAFAQAVAGAGLTEACFHKRAQILAAEIWAGTIGGLDAFRDSVGGLTAFADYRIPQYLAARGGIVYSGELRRVLDQEKELPAGSQMEVEIRAASIAACDRIAKMAGTSSVMIDFWLWDECKRRQSWVDSKVPMHRTVSKFY